jgi:DNA repair photolyase
MSRAANGPHKGRGAVSNADSRYSAHSHAAFHDDWDIEEEAPPPLETQLIPERSKTILSRNDSPDIPFEYSINPYKGCEHGCIYCYARPTHAYLSLSPGLDFETKLFYKPEAAKLLKQELAAPGYRPTAINLGSSTDPYQPCERELKLTRGVLEVLLEARHPVALVTKGVLVLRDLDLLAEMAKLDLVAVYISLTTLDPALKRILEPRAASPGARLRAIRELRAAGVPVGVNASPMIPRINDHELEQILEAASKAGAQRASTILVRLPREVSPLFQEWLATHFPDRAAHVMSLIRDTRGGADYQSEWGSRFRGSGPVAELLRRRFELACRRLGLATGERLSLSSARFRPPSLGGQLGLF